MEPNTTFGAALGQEVFKALRAGMALEAIVHTLVCAAEHLHQAQPVVRAVLDAERENAPC